VQVGEDAEHLARDVAEHRFAERPSCDPRGERLALDELGREVEAQLDTLALGKAGDERGMRAWCKVFSVAASRSKASICDAPGTLANWSSLRATISPSGACARYTRPWGPCASTRSTRYPPASRATPQNAQRRSSLRRLHPGQAVSKFPPESWTIEIRTGSYRHQREARKPGIVRVEIRSPSNHPGFPWRRGRSARRDCR